MKHTLSVVVKNHSGVLSHIAGLFSRRAYNIHSLTVGVTVDPQVSRITIVVLGDNTDVTQVKKQLNKLIDVIRVEEIVPGKAVTRELVLVSVDINDQTRSHVVELADVFNAKVCDMTENRIMFEFVGDDRKVASFLKLMEKYGHLKIARTGLTALPLEEL